MTVPSIDTQAFQTLLAGEDFLWIKQLTQDIPHAEIFLVGGIVRDIILQRESHDVDFVVRNVDADTLKQWLTQHGIVNLVGKNFGVFKFTPSETSATWDAFDIALPRVDYAQGTGGYKDVHTQSDPHLDIREDLARRDFTINAMAYDIQHNSVIDVWNGTHDLHTKCIRCVGEPKARFQEDYSRMLRALRFSCQLNFDIEQSTQIAIIEMIGCINDHQNNARIVPTETIAKELMKSLVSNPVKTMDLYDEVGAWKHIMPELLLMKNSPQHHAFHAEGDVWTHTRLALQQLSSPACVDFITQFFPKFCQDLARPLSPEMVLAVLLHDIAKPDTIKTPEKDGVERITNYEHDSIGAEKARSICERLSLSSPSEVGADIEHVLWLIRHHLIAGHARIAEMKPTTIEKYFFSDLQKSANLLTLIWADGSATLNPHGEPALDVLHQMINRINDLLSHFAQKTAMMKLPKPFMDGNEIMQTFNLNPGKQIGELLHLTREAQLDGEISSLEEAQTFIRTHLSH